MRDSANTTQRNVSSGMISRLKVLVRSNWRLISIAVCLAVFLYLLNEVLEGEIMKIDSLAYGIIVQHLRNDHLTPVMEGFSALATPMVLLVVTLTIAAFAPGKRVGWCCATNLVLVAGVNVLIKSLVQRPRPVGFRLAAETGFSFPSGHSMAAMAFYGLLIWLIWRYETDRSRRNLFTALFALIILMIGVSRIYLGVHYASDVLGGFCASIIWLALFTRLGAPLFMGSKGWRTDARETK